MGNGRGCVGGCFYPAVCVNRDYGPLRKIPDFPVIKRYNRLETNTRKLNTAIHCAG
jgi:hypothetical protein